MLESGRKFSMMMDDDDDDDDDDSKGVCVSGKDDCQSRCGSGGREGIPWPERSGWIRRKVRIQTMVVALNLFFSVTRSSESNKVI